MSDDNDRVDRCAYLAGIDITVKRAVARPMLGMTEAVPAWAIMLIAYTFPMPTKMANPLTQPRSAVKSKMC